MAATTTVSTTSLIKQLRHTYPQLEFQPGDDFQYHPPVTITYQLEEPAAIYLLLHEVGHALLDLHSYKRDIQLLTIESLAWERACEVAGNLDITIPEDIIQNALDTYRDWLHTRSICPNCMTTGVQSSDASLFFCLACETQWHANLAKACALRRYRK